MMYYRRALMLQSFLENRSLGGILFCEFSLAICSVSSKAIDILTVYLLLIEDGYSQANVITTQGFELSREARAQADLKFTYVVSCQIYGQQKQRRAQEAVDIALLMQRNEALRVAFIHMEESSAVKKEYYSKLVKADVNGKDQRSYVRVLFSYPPL
ncbi:hypothetical protein U1Q18_007155 [Sarracenia purpurea var. burkii]